MIIKCINCKKKFEVDSSLIPDSGRNIQCGSCNHAWFYKQLIEDPLEIDHEHIEEADIIRNNKTEDVAEKNVKNQQNQDGVYDIKQDLSKSNILSKYSKDKELTRPILSKIVSYFIVSIISFIALIIVLDTFKSPLNNKIPGLELLLYNLFESLRDIFLFIKDLFI